MNEKSLSRFLKAQENSYTTALNEISSGKKISHWMWYIFPQIKGLGKSYDARYYGISDLEEAQEYLANDILRERLLEICGALFALETNSPEKILGYTDAMKLKSSMTLFLMADSKYEIFQAILDKFYNGERDVLTLRILENGEEKNERRS